MKLIINQIVAAPGMGKAISHTTLKLSLLEWRGDGSTTVDPLPPTIGMDLSNWDMGHSKPLTLQISSLLAGRGGVNSDAAPGE